jgi:hypothetical protein
MKLLHGMSFYAIVKSVISWELKISLNLVDIKHIVDISNIWELYNCNFLLHKEKENIKKSPFVWIC